MTHDEYVWNQIAQVHEYLRFVGGQAMTWFAFGVGANTAALWAILSQSISLKTRIVANFLVFANILAASACLIVLPAFYIQCLGTLNSLTSKLSLFQGKANESLQTESAFTLWLWLVIAIAVGGLFGSFACGWYYASRKGYLTNRPRI